jgi:hypothetical protein
MLNDIIRSYYRMKKMILKAIEYFLYMTGLLIGILFLVLIIQGI